MFNILKIKGEFKKKWGNFVKLNLIIKIIKSLNLIKYFVILKIN